MNKLSIKKHHIILSGFMLVLLVGLVAGFVWMNSKALGSENNISIFKNDSEKIMISAVGDELIYNDGILVYTSAENSVGSRNAAVTKGDPIIYSLELTNQGNAAKTVNLKFDLPGTYKHIVGTMNCTAGITPCAEPAPSGINGPGTLVWSNVTVPIGESKISFSLRAP